MSNQQSTMIISLPKLNQDFKQKELKNEEKSLKQGQEMQQEQFISQQRSQQANVQQEMQKQINGKREDQKEMIEKEEEEKINTGRSNLNDNIKMKVEEFMNDKLSDNLFKKQNTHQIKQMMNFVNHKSSILNGIDDIKDFLNQKSQLTLYMQNLNNPKMSSKGLINSNYQIKNSSSSQQISSQSQITHTENPLNTQNSYEGFTALLKWDQTPQKYRKKYQLSQKQMDVVKQGNYESYNSSSSKIKTEANVHPNNYRKKSQSLHLSSIDSNRNLNQNVINNSVLSNRSNINQKSPRYFKVISPQNLKLTDLNLNIVRNIKESVNNNSSILQMNEDYVLPVNQENTMNTSRKSNSLNSSIAAGSQNENRWQKINLAGTSKAKEILYNNNSQKIQQLFNQAKSSITNNNQSSNYISVNYNGNVKRLNFKKFKSIQSQEYNKPEALSPKYERKLPNLSKKSNSLVRAETERDRSTSRIDIDKTERRKKFNHIGQTSEDYQIEQSNKIKIIDSLVSIEETSNENTLKKEIIEKLPSIRELIQLRESNRNRKSYTEEPKSYGIKQVNTLNSMNTQLSIGNHMWKIKNPGGVQLDHSLSYHKKSNLTRFDLKEGLKTYQIHDIMQKKIMVDCINKKTELRQVYVVYIQIKSSEAEKAHLENTSNFIEENNINNQYSERFITLNNSSSNLRVGASQKQKKIFCVEQYFIPVFKNSDDYLELQRDTQIWIELLKRMIGIDLKQQLYFSSAFGETITHISDLPKSCNIIYFHATHPSIKLIKEQFEQCNIQQENQKINQTTENNQEDSFLRESVTGQNDLIEAICRIHQLNSVDRSQYITILNHLNQLKTKEDVYLIINNRSHIIRLLSHNSKSSLKSITAKKLNYSPQQNSIHKPIKRLDSFSKVEKFPKVDKNQAMDNVFLSERDDRNKDKKVDIIFYNKLQNQRDFSKIMNRLYRPISQINLEQLEKKTELSRQELINLYCQYKSYVAMAQDFKNPNHFKINMNALYKQSYGASLKFLERVEPLVTLLRKEKQIKQGQFGDMISGGVYTEQDYKLSWEEFLQDFIEQKRITDN